MSEPYLIDVDGGTESLQVRVFDLQVRRLAFTSTAYETRFTNPGWAEQHPGGWWTALGESVR